MLRAVHNSSLAGRVLESRSRQRDTLRSFPFADSRARVTASSLPSCRYSLSSHTLVVANHQGCSSPRRTSRIALRRPPAPPSEPGGENAHRGAAQDPDSLQPVRLTRRARQPANCRTRCLQDDCLQRLCGHLRPKIQANPHLDRIGHRHHRASSATASPSEPSRAEKPPVGSSRWGAL